MTTSIPAQDAQPILDRLEDLLDQIDDRLAETSRLKVLQSQPFLSDELVRPRELFAMPPFEIDSHP